MYTVAPWQAFDPGLYPKTTYQQHVSWEDPGQYVIGSWQGVFARTRPPGWDEPPWHLRYGLIQQADGQRVAFLAWAPMLWNVLPLVPFGTLLKITYHGWRRNQKGQRFQVFAVEIPLEEWERRRRLSKASSTDGK